MTPEQQSKLWDAIDEYVDARLEEERFFSALREKRVREARRRIQSILEASNK